MSSLKHHPSQATARDHVASAQPRRAFLSFAVFSTLGACLSPRFLFAIATPGSASTPANVTIIEFTADGKKTGSRVIPKLVKSDDEWKQQLSPISYEVTRRAGTERAYTGNSWDEHAKGLFRCICCGTALFGSDTKFDSGTGWPSFWKPIARENISETRDKDFGMTRTAVSCRVCDAHLGHVFDDGPKPTGLRYCMNSAAMRFVKLS